MACQTPRRKVSVNCGDDSLEPLSNKVESDLIESKFTKKIICLLYSHLRKLAKCAMQKGETVNIKKLMEANGVVLSFPNLTPDEFDELSINVELKIPVAMFEGNFAENLMKGRKLVETLNRCKRKCCKKPRKDKNCQEGYQSEPDERRSRVDGGCNDRRRHFSVPIRRVSSEENDVEVIETRVRRIKEYLDSSIACAEDPAEIERREMEEQLCEPQEKKVAEVCPEGNPERMLCEDPLLCNEQRREWDQDPETVCVEPASQHCHGQKQRHKHHHHHHHKHRHHRNVHKGLDCLDQQPDYCCYGEQETGKKITWPKDAYLAKHQHHGTFWPLWTESPYCRDAETVRDIPTLVRSGNNFCSDDNDRDFDRRRHRRWPEMDGAHGSHFTSVSEARNNIYTLSPPNLTEEKGRHHEEPKENECRPEDLSLNPQYYLGGPSFPDTVTQVVSQIQIEDSGTSPKARLFKDGLQFNFY